MSKVVKKRMAKDKPVKWQSRESSYPVFGYLVCYANLDLGDPENKHVCFLFKHTDKTIKKIKPIPKDTQNDLTKVYIIPIYLKETIKLKKEYWSKNATKAEQTLGQMEMNKKIFDFLFNPSKYKLVISSAGYKNREIFWPNLVLPLKAKNKEIIQSMIQSPALVDPTTKEAALYIAKEKAVYAEVDPGDSETTDKKYSKVIN